MIAGFGHGVAQPAFGKFAGHQAAAIGAGDRVEQADIGRAGTAEADHARADIPGGAFERRAMFAVGGDDCRSARLEPGEDFRLGRSNGIHAAEVLDMRGCDRRNDGDMRSDLRGEIRDLARVVHAHFENGEPAARGHARQAERNPDMVVVATRRPVRRAAAGTFEAGEDRFLDPGLADRTSHPDNRRLDAAARGACQRFERGSGILDENVRPIDSAIDDRSRCAIGEGLVEETVAVHRLPLQGNEKIAIDDIAAIHLDACDLEIMAGDAAHRFGDAARIPQGQRQPVTRVGGPFDIGRMAQDGGAHAAPLAISATHSRATSTSSKGSTRMLSPDPMI